MTPTSEYREIALSQGQVAIVDASDFDWLNQWKWHAYWSEKTQSYYAIRNAPVTNGRRFPPVAMHREILGLRAGDRRKADHIENGQTLDNRRSNLRIATTAQNACNSRMHRDNKSGFKGVFWGGKSGEKWVAQLNYEGKKVFRKSFAHIRDAAQAHALMAYLYHGEFARIEERKVSVVGKPLN
jgi:hypothetical protein